MSMDKKINNRGQSLVEVIVSLFIIMISLTVVMNLVMVSKNLLEVSEIQTKANSLANQGVEIVRHQRDLGCGFSKVKAYLEDGQPKEYFAIQGDICGDPGRGCYSNAEDETIIPYNQASVSSLAGPYASGDYKPDVIKDYPGFKREIKITPLDEYSSDNADIQHDFLAAFGTVPGDEMTQYYVIEVLVKHRKDSGGSYNTVQNLKTLMHKP